MPTWPPHRCWHQFDTPLETCSGLQHVWWRMFHGTWAPSLISAFGISCTYAVGGLVSLTYNGYHGCHHPSVVLTWLSFPPICPLSWTICPVHSYIIWECYMPATEQAGHTLSHPIPGICLGEIICAYPWRTSFQRISKSEHLPMSFTPSTHSSSWNPSRKRGELMPNAWIQIGICKRCNNDTVHW